MGTEIFEIFSLGLLAFSFIVLVYYYLLMTFVLLNEGKFRFIELRLPGAIIKDFIQIIDKEKDQRIKRKYIRIYKGLKFARWLIVAVVIYFFFVLILFY